jgi:hypothetical protein
MLDFSFGLRWQYGEKKGSFAFVHRPFLEGIRDWSPAFSIIAEDVLEPYVMRAFQTEGASQLGEKWQELAPSTLRYRPPTPILQVHGDMMRSFQKGDPQHVEEISPRRLVWGSRDPKALFHQFGTGGKVNFRRAGARKTMFKTPEARAAYEAGQGKTGGIPARPMLVWSEFLANEITSKMLARIAMVARQAGYRIGSRMFGGLTPTEARILGESLLKYPGGTL